MKKLKLPKFVSCLPLTDKEIKQLNGKLNKLKLEQEVLTQSQKLTYEQLHTPMSI